MAEQSDIYDYISGLRMYCIGIVASHKPQDTDMIEVTLIERATTGSGPLKDIKTEYKVDSVDAQGVIRSDSITAGATIFARWIPLNQSNRITSPDVRAGETVMVYQYRDNNIYYWDTMFREPSIRRLERALWAFCNIPGGNEPFDKSSSYWMEFDTYRKNITISTSQSDGEEYQYQIQLDAGNNRFMMGDHLGNRFSIDSPNNDVYMLDVKRGYYRTNDGHPIIHGESLVVDVPIVRFTGNVYVDGWIYAHTGYPGGGWDNLPGYDPNWPYVPDDWQTRYNEE